MSKKINNCRLCKQTIYKDTSIRVYCNSCEYIMENTEEVLEDYMFRNAVIVGLITRVVNYQELQPLFYSFVEDHVKDAIKNDNERKSEYYSN